MAIETLIARWVGILWLAFGLSHTLHPKIWTALLFPLRERETGGFILAGISFPLGLVVVLGHNLWVWDLPVIVTVAGWMTTLKCAVYLLWPRAHTQVMSLGKRPENGFVGVGFVMMILGALTTYDAFWNR